MGRLLSFHTAACPTAFQLAEVRTYTDKNPVKTDPVSIQQHCACDRSVNLFDMVTSKKVKQMPTMILRRQRISNYFALQILSEDMDFTYMCDKNMHVEITDKGDNNIVYAQCCTGNFYGSSRFIFWKVMLKITNTDQALILAGTFSETD